MIDHASPDRSQVNGSGLSEAETRISSAEKVVPKNAIRIAPQKYSKLTEKELERLLWS